MPERKSFKSAAVKAITESLPTTSYLNQLLFHSFQALRVLLWVFGTSFLVFVYLIHVPMFDFSDGTQPTLIYGFGDQKLLIVLFV